MDANISSYMTANPVVAPPTLELSEAHQLMLEQDIRHLPVVENDLLVGIASLSDLREALALQQGSALCLGDIMKTCVYAVHPDISLCKVTREMAEMKCGSAVVINHDKQVIGMLTTTDVLFAYSESLEDKTSPEATDFDEYRLP